MADLMTLINTMREDGTVDTIARNSAAQFGRTGRFYLGATLLPEMTVPENAYREEGIKYRTIAANDGTRFSPTQKKDGDIFGSQLIELGESDIAREFTGRHYDALLRYLGNGMTMEGVVQVTSWLDTTVNLALIEHNEAQRWQALARAIVLRRGDNGYTEDVQYPNPVGHRVAQGAPWSTDTTDILEEIYIMADMLADKGLTVSRMITSRRVLSIMAANATVRTRTGIAVVNQQGQIQSATGRATRDAIAGILGQDGLPAIETYDLQYRTQTGTEYFLPRDVFIMLATTGRDENIDLGDNEELLNLPDTLGYTAIGRAAGQSVAGRVIQMEPKTDKPPRIEAEGWATSLPVIVEAEAIAVINSIT